MRAEGRKNFRGGDPVKGKTPSKHWFKGRSGLACWEQRRRTMVCRQPCEVWGQDVVSHFLEAQTEVVALYRMTWNTKFKLPQMNTITFRGKKKKAPGDLNRNLKKIKFERPWNEEKKKKKNRKESCEIKGLVLQFNTEKSMQSWIPSDLAQWRSRRKKQTTLSENQNGKQHFCQFSLHLTGYLSLVSLVDW